jgi:glycine/D-amino acid oxidase-like deaminating enzyme
MDSEALRWNSQAVLLSSTQGIDRKGKAGLDWGSQSKRGALKMGEMIQGAEQLPERPMTTIIVRARAANDDPDVLAVVGAFPDGSRLSAAMRVPRPGYLDPTEVGKALAAALLNRLIERQNTRVADGTNWPSVAAACQRIVAQWNRERRDALGGQNVMQ